MEMVHINSQMLWLEAYQSLDSRHKDVLSKCSSHGDPQMLLSTVKQKLQELEASTLRIRLPYGTTFVLRDAFEKIARWVMNFIQVGDVAMQWDPVHAALPWAALRFILTVSTMQLRQLFVR